MEQRAAVDSSPAVSHHSKQLDNQQNSQNGPATDIHQSNDLTLLSPTPDDPHAWLDSDYREMSKTVVTATRQDVSSMSSTGSVTSSRPELAYRLESLSSNVAEVPLPDVNDPNFDVRKWASAVLKRASKEKLKYRQASFAFRSLDVTGSASTANVQSTVASLLMAPITMAKRFGGRKAAEKKILSNFNGVTRPGEMLLVLGRPGSGCSTLLRTIAGELGGLKVGAASTINYNGIAQEEMIKRFKGEIVYNADVDKHFPHLTVGQTLEFAAAMRARSDRLLGSTRAENIKHLTNVVMAMCGLTHTRNTKVGNDFVRGVSGGERKRVSIAEMMLGWSPIGAWDNSTRGLDSATALSFINCLRLGADVLGTTHAVAIYQASQAIFEVFDRVVVLYEGREIFFGPTSIAKNYFEEMGWLCPPRQTTGDFCTSVTNHQERKARPGYEARVPRTPEEFEAYWRASQYYDILQNEIDEYLNDPSNALHSGNFRAIHEASQSSIMRTKSPYIVSVPRQVQVCTKRAYQRLWNDKASTLTVVLGQVVMALVVGSVFFGTANDTNSFFARGSTLFFATLLNALIAVTEINNLYQQRPIVEKHASFAFCHPAAEALAGVISDAPVKMVIAVCFNVIFYFLAGLRPAASQFFIFFLFTVLIRFTMSVMFRTVAAVTKTVSQALATAGVLVLIIIIYTGYTIPRPYMHPWFKWLTWLNPLAYAFEALVVNEFHGRDFPCVNLVPAYPDLLGDTFVCSVNGAVSGESTVSGDAYVQASFQYSYSHLWRNLGILIAFYIFFLTVYLVTSELHSGTSSTAEVLLFLHGKKRAKVSKSWQPAQQRNEVQQKGRASAVEAAQTKSVFTWRNVTYDIHIGSEPRRLLDNVSGWARPGTLTALMGVSGAGKTTLLDVLAQRTSTGVITGDMFVNGKSFDSSFQRKLGYVQQQDLHLETSTVREALRFSAVLRQPQSTPVAEKYEFVEEVIKLLEMEEFAQAIVGVPGEGLNVEQRKLLTIGVELAAKPALLLFLDEPTSGLDSQSSWAIVGFLRKLANSGQAVLSTIHQPSSILFQEFDNLLFLAKGGRTVYFGPIGPNSATLLQYFEKHGARPCGTEENPAEYILEAVTLGASDKSGRGHDWPVVWNSSDEANAMVQQLNQIHRETSLIPPSNKSGDTDEFAMSILQQTKCCTTRIFQQYWRTPSYIWGKMTLGLASALYVLIRPLRVQGSRIRGLTSTRFIGFSFFQSDDSLQGMQNIVFSLFMLTSILSSMVQQIMPRFVMQRSLYEARERPSKIYSWIAFMIANVVVEIFYQVLLGVLVYVCYYYATFGIQSSDRQGLILLLCIEIFVFASTFAQMIIVALPDAQTAGALATLMFSLTMIFNGVFQPPQALPGFWIFMYRISPLTYLIGALSATGLSGRPIACSPSELNVFQPPTSQTCGAYMKAYLARAPGQLINPDADSNCSYCPLTNADQFLRMSGIEWDDRWRNFGIVWGYIVFNIAATLGLYYVFRVAGWRPATLDQRRRRWVKVGKRLRRAALWAGIWTRALIMGSVGMVFSQEQKDEGDDLNQVY